MLNTQTKHKFILTKKTTNKKLPEENEKKEDI